MMERLLSVFGRCLLASSLLAGVLVDAGRAQGPVYRERWGYLHLENLRREVERELRGRPAADVQRVAELLVAPDRGVPFRPVASALAHLRGVDDDEAFLLRAMIGSYVLPEVVDPGSTVEACRSLNVSMFLPFPIELTAEVQFEVIVRDAAGKVVERQQVERRTGFYDLRMAKCKATFAGAGLADGSYTVEVRTVLDGNGPRPTDHTLRWPFYVQRGYQQRSEVAMATATVVRRELEPLPRAMLDGIAVQVSRAYQGEAFDVRSHAVADLQRLERCLANLDDDRAAHHGLRGEFATAMPAGEIVQPCSVRIPADEQPHPLVVFATGAPAYDANLRRPNEPQTRSSTWLQYALADFGREQQWHVAFVDSPGGGRPYAMALQSAIETLPALLPTGGRKPLLVCDREAAAVVGMSLPKLRPLLAGVVLIGSGAVPGTAFDQLADFPIRAVALHGYPGSSAIDRMQAFLDARRQAGESLLDYEMLHDRALPWLFGIEQSQAEIANFASELFRDQ